jgi:hypothetical protein
MKTIKVNPIETEPEVIAEISENESAEIQGGVTSSCMYFSCNPK